MPRRPAPRRRLVGTALALLLAGTSAAQSAAPGKQAPPLGRLFFTAQQRQELDRRRALNIKEKVVVRKNRLTLNGFVSRSSGRTTAWVNGVPVNDRYRSQDPSEVAVQPGVDEPGVPLKVGQTLDTTRATITDDLGGGRVSVDRPSEAQR